MSLTNVDKQDLRHAALYALANRPRQLLTAGQVSLSIRRLIPFPFEQSDVLDALVFLVGLEHARKERDDFGAEDFFQITTKGTLAYERDFNKTG
jgi:hypothetical protein